MSNPGPVFVDNTDGSIVFLGSWWDVSTDNQQVFDKTLISTSEGTSTVSYTFFGTQIAVFGTIREHKGTTLPPISVYSIDGGGEVEYAATSITQEADGIEFFQQGGLTAGKHQLFIKVTRASDDNPYFIDYFTYMPVASTAPANTPAPQSSSPSPTSSPTRTPTQIPTPTPTPPTTPPAQTSRAQSQTSPSATPQQDTQTGVQPASSRQSSPSSAGASSLSDVPSLSGSTTQVQAHSTLLQPVTGGSASPTPSSSTATSSAASIADNASVRSSTPVGAIVGGVIGGVALLAAIIFAFLFICRRRRTTPNYDTHPEEKDIAPVKPELLTGPAGVTPFLLARDYNTSGVYLVSPAQDITQDHSLLSPRKGGASTPVVAGTSSSPMGVASGSGHLYASEGVSDPSTSGDVPSSSGGSQYGPGSDGAGWGSGGETSSLTPLRRAQQNPLLATYSELGAGSDAGSSSGSQVGALPGPAVWDGPEESGSKGVLARLQPQRVPHTQFADSGIRFMRGTGPRTDDMMSEVPSEIPPAYTAD